MILPISTLGLPYCPDAGRKNGYQGSLGLHPARRRGPRGWGIFLPLEIKVGYINSSVAVFFPHTGFGVKVIKSQERVEFQRTETLDV